MVSKTQITIFLVTCAVLLLLVQPAVSQMDALRWGKRDSGLSEEYAAENARNWRRQQENKREYYGTSPSILLNLCLHDIVIRFFTSCNLFYLNCNRLFFHLLYIFGNNQLKDDSHSR